MARTFTYQWQRNTGAWADINGATTQDYTPMIDDVSYPLRLRVLPSDGVTPAYSNATNPTLTTAVLLASESFDRANGALGSTDGLAISFASGGSGLTWTASQGTAAISSNKAIPSTLGSSACIQTIDVGESDVVVQCDIETASSALVGIVVRYVDANNYVRAYHTGANVSLRKRVAGVDTLLINDATVPYVAGATLKVTANGSKFRLYYNGVVVGSEQTVADAALSSSTKVGVYATSTGSTLRWNNFAAWGWSDYNLAVARIGPADGRLEIVRQNASNFLIRSLIDGEVDPNRVLQWTLQKITSVPSGWGAASNCWHILGMAVVDISGANATIDMGFATSALEYAFQLGAVADGSSDYGFIGSIHQAQVSLTFSILADGVDISSLATGAAAYADQLVVTQTMNTIYPKDKASVVGSTTLTHTFTPDYLQVDHSHSFSAGYQYYTFYSAMMPGADTAFDTYQVDGFSPAAAVGDDGAKQSGTEATMVTFSHSSAHDYLATVILPTGGPANPSDWSRSGPLKTWVQDRADAIIKAYINYISGTFADRVTAGSSAHQTRYTVTK